MVKKQPTVSFSSLITVSLLIGFIGFGLGFNWPTINQAFNRHFTKQSQNLPETLDFSSLQAIYDVLRQNFAGQLNPDALIEGAKAGLVQSAGDPYTTYLNAQAAKQFEQDLNGTFSGIGAEIAIKKDRLVIVAPLAGSPAKAAGLAAGDMIAQINHRSAADLSVEAAVSKIRGPAGTKVSLTIVRDEARPKEFIIQRAVITIPSVTSKMEAHSIGYIQLSRFGDDSAVKLHEAATKLREQGAKRIIFDLRDNPGGLLDQAVKIADEFLDGDQEIVEERRDDTVLETEHAQPGGALAHLPAVVLVNKGSASASEIIAGALQDNHAATIVGSQTFGKGSVQQLMNLGGKAVLKVTIALWYTPSGHNISKEGVTPDVKVDLTSQDFNNSRDPQLRRALHILSAR